MSRWKTFLVTVLLVSLLNLLSASGKSQSREQEIISLTISSEHKQQAEVANITFTPASGNRSSGTAPGGVLVEKELLADGLPNCRLRVDSNGDGNLTDETWHLLAPDDSVHVTAVRKWTAGKQAELPYRIHYRRGVNARQQTHEYFMWAPEYSAAGKIKAGQQELLLVVYDFNGDGMFDRKDFRHGTTIGLDRNQDGKIYGSDEYLKGEQIIELSGYNYLIADLAPDGTRLVLRETKLSIPKVGEPLPDFVLTTLAGSRLKSAEMKGRVFLLDFWASWCGPCIEKFPLVEKLAQETGHALTVIAISVDDEKGLPAAQKIIAERKLPFTHVASGKGDDDLVWRLFGAMAENRMTGIPFYVLVDSQGIIRFAGRGNDDLSDLRAVVHQAIKPMLEKRQ
jgi:thiol-disulfide isomerase/thioredoxin